MRLLRRCAPRNDNPRVVIASEAQQSRCRGNYGPDACYTPAMASDVIDLRDFYRGALGQVARRMIRRAIQRVWPDLRGMRLLGLGYATPFLSALMADTE